MEASSSSAPGARFAGELLRTGPLAAATCVLAAGPLQSEDLRQIELFRRFLADRKAVQDRYAALIDDLKRRRQASWDAHDAQIDDLKRRRQAEVDKLLERYDRDAKADPSSSIPAENAFCFDESAGEG